jgi:nitrogen regulatory protein PII-like uncharacterized protein
MKKTLNECEKNIFSQNGEDGIINEVFELLPTPQKICIEFGAWDGFHLSNTANLWANQNWKGILIEADKQKFIDLINNTADYNCVCINEFVSFPEENTLEIILDRHRVDYSNIAFLSIDIDGDDWYVFESLKKLHPTVICCEFNPRINNNNVYKVTPRQSKEYIGCSMVALEKLGREKDYTLVAVTSCNLIFVKNEYNAYFENYLTGDKLLKTKIKELKIKRILYPLINLFYRLCNRIPCLIPVYRVIRSIYRKIIKVL